MLVVGFVVVASLSVNVRTINEFVAAIANTTVTGVVISRTIAISETMTIDGMSKPLNLTCVVDCFSLTAASVVFRNIHVRGAFPLFLDTDGTVPSSIEIESSTFEGLLGGFMDVSNRAVVRLTNVTLRGASNSSCRSVRFMLLVKDCPVVILERLTVANNTFCETVENVILADGIGNLSVSDSLFTHQTINSSLILLTDGTVATIVNSEFSHNAVREEIANRGNGVIQLRGGRRSGVTLRNVLFQQNAAWAGSCVFTTETSGIVVSGSRFFSNTAKRDGGAIFARNITISKSSFFDNEVVDDGGAVVVGSQGRLLVEDSDFVANRGAGGDDGRGAAIFLEDGASAHLVNVSVKDNVALRNGGGILFLDVNAQLSLEDSCVCDNLFGEQKVPGVTCRSNGSSIGIEANESRFDTVGCKTESTMPCQPGGCPTRIALPPATRRTAGAVTSAVTTSSSTAEKAKDNNVPVAVGASLGGVAALAVLAAVVYLCLAKKRRDADAEHENEPETQKSEYASALSVLK
jgi:predicted outer membrane repeat protein